MEKYQVIPDAGFYNTLIKVFVEHGIDEKRILEIAEKMEKDEEIGMDSISYTMLMQLYGKKGELKSSMIIFEKMIEKSLVDLHAYNTIMHICLESKSMMDKMMAFEIYKYLEKDYRFSEDKRTFDILFRVAEITGKNEWCIYLLEKILKLSSDTEGRTDPLKIDLPLLISAARVSHK